MMGIREVLLLWFLIFFVKKTAGGAIKNKVKQNKQLAEELHKPIINKFLKRKVYSSFKEIIWGVDLADMQLISKFNKRIRFLLWVIDIFNKYAWVVPLKDKKGTTIVRWLKKKPNKIWVDKGSEFYKRSMKLWLEKHLLEL